METISPKELDRYVGTKRAFIIDLRSREDYIKGHVKGAINAPGGRIGELLKGKQNVPVVLYCDRGSFSLKVARELEEKGYQTKSVVGGYNAICRREFW